MRKDQELIYKEECYEIMGLIFDVYNEIGFGHKESFYQKAIAKIFEENKIPYREQLRRKVKFRGNDLGVYIFDFLVFDKIIIELKQKNYFSSKDIDQLYRYLKATKLKLGLLVNITKEGIRYKRIANIY